MAPELSSNWKKLQATLKKESKSSAGKKRKPEPTERQQHTISKRRRLEGKPEQRPPQNIIKKKIGGMSSSQTQIVETDKANQAAPSASLAQWAEDNDISPQDLAAAYGERLKDTSIRGTAADKINGGLCADVEIGKYVALDCEMVGVGPDSERSVLARVSIVNFHGAQIYDSFVRPKEFVTDWRTHVSGVSSKDMATARSFEDVQADVGAILKDRVIVGHAIKNDLEAMMLGHPKKDIRDTSKFSGFRKYSAGKTPSLKKLAKEVLGIDIQGGEHSSIEDARATMLLFRRHKSAFDVEHAARFPTQAPGSSARPKIKKKKGKK
jgi:RNA exonuclease 4